MKSVTEVSSSGAGTIRSRAFQRGAQQGFPEPGEPQGEQRELLGAHSSHHSGWRDLGGARSNSSQAPTHV